MKKRRFARFRISRRLFLIGSAVPEKPLPCDGSLMHSCKCAIRQTCALSFCCHIPACSANLAANASDCIQPNKSGPLQVWGNSSSFENQAEKQSGPTEAAWQDKSAALHRHLLPNFKASFEAPERRSARSPGNTYPLHSPLLVNVPGVEAGRTPRADQSARAEEWRG